MPDDQDVAKDWLSFSQEKRDRLLSQMTPEGMKNLRRAVEAHKDFTRNPKGEGLYRMGSYDFSGGKVTKPEIQVPFSRIDDALTAGYKLHPDETERYSKDVAHKGEGPTLWDRTKGLATRLTEPMPDAPVYGVSPGRSVVNALGNVGKLPFNVVNRTVRGLAGLPGQTVQTVGDIATGRPEGLEALDPATTGENEWKGYQSDAETLGPWAALGNVGGDVATMYVAGKATEAPGKIASGELRQRALENLRGGIRDTMGVAENTEKTVGKFGAESEAVRAKNVAEAEKNRQARVKALQQQREAERGHQTASGETREHNVAVLRDRAKRMKAEQDLDLASRRLQQRIETAQKRAKAVDDAAWAAWRDKVGAAEADPTPIREIIGNMHSVMDPEDVAEFRRVIQESTPEVNKTAQEAIIHSTYPGKRWEQLTQAERDYVGQALKAIGFDPNVVQPVSADRLHVWKTQLEYAVRKATRGNVRYAIGQVLDSVRDMETQLSAAAGADKELNLARRLHGPYMDTFRNSPNMPVTVASNVRAKVTPEFTKESGMDRQIAMLGRYDSSIPNLVDHIGNLQQGLRALPKDAPLREQLKPNPPPLEASGKPKPIEPTSPPEAPNLQAENRKFINRQLRRYGRVGSWVLRGLVGGGTIALAHGNLGELGGGLLLGQAGVTLLTKALRSEGVLNWLAKPSAEDMRMFNSLPPEDAAHLRTALNTLANYERTVDAPARKIRIAPAMARFLSATAERATQIPTQADVFAKTRAIGQTTALAPRQGQNAPTLEEIRAMRKRAEQNLNQPAAQQAP